FPDKTMYPVASQNDKDFKNLMDVYLNAVYFPNIYKYKEIFLQEGWHYEIFDKKDPIKINGVVYSEMKGAYSSSDEVLQETMMNELFKGTTYQYESGGHPDIIPTLKYEDFLDFHHKYYSPSNSYIFLYGKMDMNERLEYLDKEYLSKFEKIDIHPIIELSKDFTKPIEKTIEYPVNKGTNLKNKTNFGYAIRLNDALNVKENMAFNILDKVLINSTSGILKNKLLAAGIGDDVSGGLFDGIRENSFMVVAKNTTIEKKEEFIKIINDTIAELTNGKLNHEIILALINNIEFAVRENMIDRTPLGLRISMTSLNSWIYDDNKPLIGFNKLAICKELKEDLNKGYFEKLLDKYFTNNKNFVLIIQEPSLTIQEENDKALVKKLEDFKALLTDKEITDLILMNKNLREYQSKQDSQENLNKIPHLSESDLVDLPEDYKCELKKLDFNFYHSDYFTNDISYITYNFDAKDFPIKYASEFALFAVCIGACLPTKHMNEEKLDQYTNFYLGAFKGFCDLRNVIKKEDYVFNVGFSFSTLNENIEYGNNLVMEIISSIDFNNENKLKEILGNEKSSLEQSCSFAGHRVGILRAGIYKSKYRYLNDLVSGIGYLDFLNDMLNNFEVKKAGLIKDLEFIRNNLFTRKKFSCLVVTDKKDYAIVKKAAYEIYDFLREGKTTLVPSTILLPKDNVKEAIICPSNVNYVCRFANNQKDGVEFSGSLAVLSKILDIDYYWQNLRVKGGAYGGGSLTSFDCFCLYSYRDPHLVETDKVYLETPKFIKTINYSDTDFLKFKIGSINDRQSVIHVSEKGLNGYFRLTSGIKYEDIVRIDSEIKHCTQDEVRALESDIKKIISDSSLCVLGTEKDINENKDYFTTIRKLEN
ncbi:MAG: insulinase family protein, partial [Bacilli bacterium]